MSKKEQNIKVVVVDLKNNFAKEEVIGNSLDSFYSHAHCSTIDIVDHKINGHWYDFIADDEGLFKPVVIPSVCDANGKIMICGSVIICNSDPDTGEEASLTDKQVKDILSHVQNILFKFQRMPSPVVWTDDVQEQ